MSRYKVDIPVSKKGSAEIRKELTDRIISSGKEPLEEYTMLFINDAKYPIMSDSYEEAQKHQEFFEKAKGDILIAGLGLGMCHKPLMEKNEVKSVTIIEINKDVIDLVWNHCDKDERFILIHQDILTWEPPKNKKYDVGWFDISFEEINYKEFKQKILDKYESVCDNILFCPITVKHNKYKRKF